MPSLYCACPPRGSSAGSSNVHAIAWNGSPASYVDLNPSGFDFSYANATNGNQQVGYGEATASSGFDHALLWLGSSASAVDLNPSGFTNSYAYDVDGMYQVGYG